MLKYWQYRGLENKMKLAQNLERIQQNAKINLPFTTIGGIFSQANLRIIFAIAGILLLIYLLFGGLQLMFSTGDPKKIEAAKGKITNAIIGFVIIFISYWIVQLVGILFNIQIIKDIFK